MALVGEAQRLVSDQGSARAAEDSYAFPRWVRIASRVGGVATVGAFYVASNVWAGSFNANPGIACTAGLAAGTVRPLIAALIDTDGKNRPNRFDSGLYSILTKFDVPIFLTLSLAQWITPETAQTRQVWFPLIFLHGGSVISWELLQKIFETRVNLGEKRPLLEGDTEGSSWPFFLKGGVVLVAGVASTIFGGVAKSHAAWRLGLIGIGYGVGIVPAQRLFSQLKRLKDHFASLVPSARMMQGSPTTQRLLGTLASIAGSLGKLGVCGAGAVLVTIPSASSDINVSSAFSNFFVGLPFAVLDVSQQHRYQNPEIAPDSPVEDIQEARRDACYSRVWRDIRARPADYAGIAITGALLSALVISNVVVPSPNSIMNASLLAGGAALTFGAGRVVEAIWPPGKDAVRNEIIFRGMRSACLFGAALIPLLGLYVKGELSLLEQGFMWGLYGAVVGASLHEMLTTDPDLPLSTTMLYLLLFSVTATLYMERQI